MRRHLQLGLGIAVSAVCLVLAVQGLELDQVGHALAGARYVWLLPALALYFGGVWVRAVRWRTVLTPLANIPAARLFPVVVIGYMANNVLPARLGEIARCYVLRRREGIPQSAALGTVLLERVMDGITMLAFMAGTLPLLPFSVPLYR
ncbi:MAG: lysylphosphatidylglycerol synthase transmembrane domain-containing protein, partial [Chloroflexota bacterium]